MKKIKEKFKLSIKNYEAIKNLEVEFLDGITQITGESNIGKSCMIRSIQDFKNNSTTENEITKGQKEMVIQVNGNIFSRNKTKKKYVINGIEFNKPGRGKFNELEFLRLGDVNFQNQQSTLFLLSNTSGERYKYIIGDRDKKYISAIKLMNNSLSELKAEKKVRLKDHQNNHKKLEEINIKKSKYNYDLIEEVYQKIIALEDRLYKLSQIKDLFYEIKELKSKKDKIKFIDKKKLDIMSININNIFGLSKLKLLGKELRILEKKLNSQIILNKTTLSFIKKLINNYEILINKEKINNLTKQKENISFFPQYKIETLLDYFKKIKLIKKKEELKILKTQSFNYDNLIIDISKLSFLFEKNKKIHFLNNLSMEIYNLKLDKHKIDNELKEIDKKEISLRKKLKICPTCGGDLIGIHTHI